jgi:hypothetical protein
MLMVLYQQKCQVHFQDFVEEHQNHIKNNIMSEEKKVVKKEKVQKPKPAPKPYVDVR